MFIFILGGEKVEGSVTEENKGEVRFVISPPTTVAPLTEWGFWGPWTSECECKEGYHGAVKTRIRSCPEVCIIIRSFFFK